MVIEDIGNRLENAEFGFRIKKELLEDVKEMLRNTSEIRKLDGTRSPCLRKVKKGKLFTEVRKMKEILKKIEAKDVTEQNDLLYLGAALVTKLFEKNKTKCEKKVLVENNKDLERLNPLLEGKKMKKKHQDNFLKTYKFKKKGKPKLKEEIM